MITATKRKNRRASKAAPRTMVTGNSPGEVGSRSVHPSPGTIRQKKRVVNPSAEARHAASPVLGPRPAQNVQQNESSMSGRFSEKYFRLSRQQIPQDRQGHDQQHGKNGSAPDPVHSRTSKMAHSLPSQFSLLPNLSQALLQAFKLRTDLRLHGVL
jgi:hypothetical protein